MLESYPDVVHFACFLAHFLTLVGGFAVNVGELPRWCTLCVFCCTLSGFSWRLRQNGCTLRANGWKLRRNNLTPHQFFTHSTMLRQISLHFGLDHLHLAFYNVKMKSEPNEDVT